jgi:dCTP deaminase
VILSGPEIKKQVGDGSIIIDPFSEKQLNPASYDLRLGSELILVSPIERHYEGSPYHGKVYPIDCAFEDGMPCYDDRCSIGVDGVELQPGRLYLGHTVERICAVDKVPIIDGKSSVGRLGVFVHVTAGYCDPGFYGQITLEILVTYPTILYAGMRIAQVRFEPVLGELALYDGNYTGEYAHGPQPSRIWRQFEKDAEASNGEPPDEDPPKEIA